MINYCPRIRPRTPCKSLPTLYDNPAFGIEFEDVEVPTPLKSLNNS